MTPDSVTIGDHNSVNSRVMDIQITDFEDFIKKMELDYNNNVRYGINVKINRSQSLTFNLKHI